MFWLALALTWTFPLTFPLTSALMLALVLALVRPLWAIFHWRCRWRWSAAVSAKPPHHGTTAGAAVGISGKARRVRAGTTFPSAPALAFPTRLMLARPLPLNPAGRRRKTSLPLALNPGGHVQERYRQWR
jgi:hypothetical protein